MRQATVTELLLLALCLIAGLLGVPAATSVAAQNATPGVDAPVATTPAEQTPVRVVGVPLETPVPGQTPTPIAAGTPEPMLIEGGIPCTALFGIASDNACVIFLQASPDAGSVDVYVDGVLVQAGLTFGGLRDFLPLTAGMDRRIQVVPSGAALTEAIIDTRIDLGAGIPYEFAVMGPAADAFAQVLQVNTRPLDNDAARFRVVHAAPFAPAIDLAVTGGEVLVDDLEYPNVAEYTEVPSGIYNLEARVAGTTDVTLPLPGVLLAANTVYTIYVVGPLADGSLGFFLVPVLVSPGIAAAATPAG